MGADARRPRAPLALAFALAMTLVATALALAPAPPTEDAILFRRKRESSAEPLSLTFAVDTTTSMGSEIYAVKHAITSIFETMKSRFSGHTIYYILVDFNDPDVHLVTKTTNTEEFRKHVDNLSLRTPRGPCPEMSMTGLKIAITESLPKSDIFLFTDATAIDYEIGPEVVNLVQRKGNKVIFVLTGKCGDDNKPTYEIYEEVATISNGHIFYLEKYEVEKVLKFVQEDFGKKVVVKVSHIPGPGISSSNISVDPSMSKLTVTVTGKDPSISFKDPKGNLVSGYSTLHLGTVLSKTVISPAPGKWEVIVSTNSPGRFVVSADSTFSIAYGFSVNSTETFTETAPRPLTGTNNFLLMQVRNSSDTIELFEVKVKDYSYNVLFTKNLHPVSIEPGTYKTDTFFPPSSIFFLEVHGRDTKNNSVARTSTGILAQEPEPPIITSTELTANLKSPFKLMCHVESLIPFSATWYKGNDKISSEEQFPQTARFHYLIENTTRDSAGIYTCEARNKEGFVKQQVTLHVIEAPPTVKTPKEIELLSNQAGEIPCQVESDLPYSVTWTKKEISGSEQSISGSKYIIDAAGNLTVSSLQKSDEGIYQCTATSKVGNDSKNVSVRVLERVDVVVSFDKLEFKLLEHVQLQCTASGSPSPSVMWKKDSHIIQDSDPRIRREDKMLFLDIQNATKHDEGVYECEGKNKVNTGFRQRNISHS